MNWSASVLSTVSSDTEPVIIVTFDQAKYIFNAGESSGRVWQESKEHWRKTKGVFLTSVGTRNGAGLAGLLMFMADTAIGRLTIAGPPGTLHFMAQMRSYLYRSQVFVEPVEADPFADAASSEPQPVFRDENITLYGMYIAPGFFPQSVPQDEVGTSTSSVGDKRKRSPSPHSASKRSGDSASWEDRSPLQQRMRQPNFTPTTLQGAQADEWRRLCINAMFRATEPPNGQRAEKPSPKKLEASAASSFGMLIAPDTEARQAHRMYIPNRDHQLPAYRYPNDQPNGTMCYVCVGPRQRGKFNVEKAQELGVPRGPIRSLLTRGETITFEVRDGRGGKIQRTVRPEECLGESENPRVVIILDVPSTEHIPSLVSQFEESPFYRRFIGTEYAHEYTVNSIFHTCGPGVLEDDRYKAFMARFAPDVNHVVASREHAPDPATFTRAGYMQLRLNKLDEGMFPMPKFRLEPPKQLSEVPGLPKNTCHMASHLWINIRPPAPPKQDPRVEGLDQFHPAILGTQPLKIPPEVTSAFLQARQDAEIALANREAQPGDNVVVVPLGTGSAVPTRYRNVSATLIRIPNWGSVLLDAGEGAWGQLVRLYGDDPERKTGVWEVLRDLKCIFLSHIHGDHHLGTPKILAMRQKMNPPPTEPLYLIGIRAILCYLREFNEIEDLGFDKEDGAGVVTILSDAINWRESQSYSAKGSAPWLNYDLSWQRKGEMCRALGLEDFLAVDVYHRTRCYGAVLRHTDGWSIVFSGDTMPTQNLVEAGRGATLLIHEATMADDEWEQAKLKAHSTFGQAVGIGRQMLAENILLTHFSARYPRAPPKFEAQPGSPGRRPSTLAFAFDHSVVPIGEMERLRVYLPAIKQNFGDLDDEDEVSIVAHTSW